MKLARIALVFVLLVVAFQFCLPVYAQDDSSVIHCAPENAPVGPEQSATFSVQRGDEVLATMNFYRLSTVIEESGVCALSGWLATNQYNSVPDFSQAPQFTLLVTDHEIVLSITSTVLLEVFGLQASYYGREQTGVVYRLEMTDTNAYRIVQIVTSVATLTVEEPEVLITFDTMVQ